MFQIFIFEYNLRIVQKELLYYEKIADIVMLLAFGPYFLNKN